MERQDRETGVARPSSGKGDGNGRMEWMDALRGVAVLCVVFQHYFTWDTQTWFGRFLDTGAIGVVSFFCISGYIIPWSVLKRHVTAPQFIRLRFFRLYPSYWVALFLAALTLNVPLATLAVNATMVQRFVGAPDAIGVFWTLQIELLFYAAITALLISGRLRQPRVSVAILACACALGLVLAAGRYFLHIRTPVAPAFGLVVMFSSLVFFLHRTTGYLSRQRFRLLLCAVALVMAVSLCLAYAQDWGFRETPARYLFCYSFGCLLFILFQRWNIRPGLLRWTGRISYPLYLLHVPVRALALHCLPGANDWTIIPAALTATIAVSALVHYFIEVPGSRLGHGHVAA